MDGLGEIMNEDIWLLTKQKLEISFLQQEVKSQDTIGDEILLLIILIVQIMELVEGKAHLIFFLIDVLRLLPLFNQKGSVVLIFQQERLPIIKKELTLNVELA